MRKTLLFLTFLLTIQLWGQVKSPKEFLITEYGKHFTPHHLLVDYAYHLSENSDYMTIEQYGYTNEKRPLLLATFTHPDNQQNLEKIRESNLGVVGFKEAKTDVDKAIIWLSFGVHGNEAAGPESSMTVMYRLANPDQQVEKWLEESVILLDPTINPDGFSRYTHWVRSISGTETHPQTDDQEHMEPWPGGRVNHYLFDLNRDWAWQTQVESQQRMKKYNEWMPHIHVDFHEMGYNAPYYFAPAAKPYHQYITDWQKNFQVDIGRNHAKYFDKEGWLYFTRETYDLFYPSYGDTYPTYNGAIGMTYEKGGSGRAGRAVIMDNGDTLSLQDRIDQHVTTALSTIETTIAHKADVIQNFKTYFENALENPKGKFATYVIKKSPNVKALASLLKKNKIDFSYSNEEIKSSGYNYYTRKTEEFEVEKGDLIINVKQPKSTFLQILMEPEPALEDSLTYDITAWSLPFAYGVQAFGVDDPLRLSVSAQQETEQVFNCTGKNYAYYFPWGSQDDYQALAQLLTHNVHVRLAGKDANIDNKNIHKSYLVAMAGDNKHLKNFDPLVQNIAKKYKVNAGCLSTGLSAEGRDLGGRNFTLLDNPRILTISGDGVSTNAFGQIWYFFEKVLHYPLSIVDNAKLSRVKLDDFDIFILPDGYYSLSAHQMNTIKQWVKEGGKIIAIGGALDNFHTDNGFALTKYATEGEKKAAERARTDKHLSERLESYEGVERRNMRNNIPGAIIKNKVDTSHPLTFGLGEHYYSLKTSKSHYNLLSDAWNAIYIPTTLDSYGFIGADLQKKLPETVTYAVEENGRGSIIYMVDNPLFRGFWHGGLQVFANALFLVE